MMTSSMVLLRVVLVVLDLALPEYGGGGVIHDEASSVVDEASSLPGGFRACWTLAARFRTKRFWRSRYASEACSVVLFLSCRSLFARRSCGFCGATAGSPAANLAALSAADCVEGSIERECVCSWRMSIDRRSTRRAGLYVVSNDQISSNAGGMCFKR
jgi:hypothetical protein